MIGRIDRGKSLTVEIFFREPGILHRQARSPSQIFRRRFFWLAGLAAEPVGRCFADADDRCFSSYTHCENPFFVFAEIFQPSRAVKLSERNLKTIDNKSSTVG